MQEKPFKPCPFPHSVLSRASQSLTKGAMAVKASEDAGADPPHQRWIGTGHGKRKLDKSVPPEEEAGVRIPGGCDGSRPDPRPCAGSEGMPRTLLPWRRDSSRSSACHQSRCSSPAPPCSGHAACAGSGKAHP